MDTLSDQDRAHLVLLRVCTGKKDQAEAKRIASQLDDTSAKVAMSYLGKYKTPEYNVLSKAIATFISSGSFTPSTLRVLCAVVPVMTAFGLEPEEAVFYLRSMAHVFENSLINREEPELVARGVMVGFIVQNPETQPTEHLQWVGEKAEELAGCADLLKLRRSIDRSTCDLALAGVPFTVPLQSGAL